VVHPNSLLLQQQQHPRTSSDQCFVSVDNSNTIMDIVKQGYVRVRSKRLSLWKKRWIILRRASSKGPVRIEKYIDERSSRNVAHTPKILYCDSVTNVCRLSSTVKVHSFAISFNSNSLDAEAIKWFACNSGNFYTLTLLLMFVSLKFPGLNS